MVVMCVLKVFFGFVFFVFWIYFIMWEVDMLSLLKKCYEEYMCGFIVLDIVSYDI